MGQAVSTFFTATVVDVAKNAWGVVVKGVTAFGKWLEKEVMSLVTSVINTITNIAQGIKTFFINCWHSVEAFTKKIFGLEQNLKDHVWNGVYEVGKGLVSAGKKHMRERLTELGYKDVDSLTDDRVEELWNEHLSQHPLTPEEQKEMDDTFPDDSDKMASTGGYSKLRSLAATSPQHSEQFKRIKDHAITHLTFVLCSTDQLKIGLPKSIALTPHEEEELNRILLSD